ncbi:hypothetical protein BRADI_1g74340v3 [Brachypodium distachyon]|uniref:Uncharacterized protein n=1 Tax=Brachypodium distachyon TaxID=15368 RepID=A0A0Q3LJS2_BRADI|nr:hypothetical protein BRADI_1g74340v3 [Brachypodium distachyon]KQK23522.1 hypothetical protein BRADI_1g74340v3 [Brachypodium distachyon]
MVESGAGAGDLLLHDFERILHDDPNIDEVGFLHPTQMDSLPLLGSNKSPYLWCSDHKLAISTHVLPDLYRAARQAHSKAATTSPSADAPALIMLHSKALLILCPDSFTAWNSRKKVLSADHNLTQLEAELQFCALILSYALKNESTWSHRRWVITKLAQSHQDMPQIIDKESVLVKQIAEKSKMNYRAWRHRCWLIPYMKPKQVLDELNKSIKWGELHVADNCCFHYRRTTAVKRTEEIPFTGSQKLIYCGRRNCGGMRCSSDATKGESPCGPIVGSSHSGGCNVCSAMRKPACQRRSPWQTSS